MNTLCPFSSQPVHSCHKVRQRQPHFSFVAVRRHCIDTKSGRVVKEAEARRNEILDAAEILFTGKGYAKTTIIDILEAVGIAKGTFYYHFKSKEEVMDAIIDRIVEGDPPGSWGSG